MLGKYHLTEFLAAVLFGLGLAVSGMTSPEKVVGFLDITGDWDPSLMMVMVGAITVNAIFYRVVKKMPNPLFSSKFLIPQKRDFTWQLVLGSAIFGIGWGLAGFCPGPGLVSLVSGQSDYLPATVLFVVSMIAGMLAYKWAPIKK